MTDDLTTRLLEAIGRAAAEALDEVRSQYITLSLADGQTQGRYTAHCECGWETVDTQLVVEDAVSGHVLEKHPSLMFRLCQAHREIVELHQPVDGHYQYWSEPMRWFCVLCSEGVVDTMRTGDLYPCRTLRALASAYGLDTPREDT